MATEKVYLNIYFASADIQYFGNTSLEHELSKYGNQHLARACNHIVCIVSIIMMSSFIAPTTPSNTLTRPASSNLSHSDTPFSPRIYNLSPAFTLVDRDARHLQQPDSVAKESLSFHRIIQETTAEDLLGCGNLVYIELNTLYQANCAELNGIKCVVYFLFCFRWLEFFRSMIKSKPAHLIHIRLQWQLHKCKIPTHKKTRNLAIQKMRLSTLRFLLLHHHQFQSKRAIMQMVQVSTRLLATSQIYQLHSRMNRKWVSLDCNTA